MNWRHRIVFPVPGSPLTSMASPLGKPGMKSVSPSMPMSTHSIFLSFCNSSSESASGFFTVIHLFGFLTSKCRGFYIRVVKICSYYL